MKKSIINRCVSAITSLTFLLSSFHCFQNSIIKANASSVIEKAIEWAVNTANDDSHGYDQDYRWGPDYDCSSFVITAFKNAGVYVGNATNTYNMCVELSQYGFSLIEFDRNKLQRGDILWQTEHTELYIGDNSQVGAHINENNGIKGGKTGDQTGDEISVTGYYNDNWSMIIRYGAISDDTPPVISEIYISQMDETGYTVNCKVTDNVGVDRVIFPTWTLKEDANGNNQDDLVWGTGTHIGDYYSYRVNISDHNNEKGEYLTHIYAYDYNGKSTAVSAGVTTPQNDTVKPVISDILITHVDPTGYTVECKVTDDQNISRVVFPTWTTANEQDDIVWGWGNRNGNIFSYRVNKNDHNGEIGDYLTHIYAYDYSGNEVSDSAGVTTIVQDTSLIRIDEAYISDLDASGYTVNCTVKAYFGIDKVVFPTWTIENGQDDIIWGTGENDKGRFSYRVNISDHNNEKGEYLTHIYAYDNNVNKNWVSLSVGVTIPQIDDVKPVISEISISEVTQYGYVVKCKVADNYNVSRVIFPTWTLKKDANGNDQDDIIWGWGERDGDTFSYRVNVSEHNGEIGDYLTHIYAYDYANNVVSESAGVINPTVTTTTTSTTTTQKPSTTTTTSSTTTTTATSTTTTPITTTTLEKTEITLKNGEQYTIPIKLDNITFKSTNTDVAVVSPKGIVTAVGLGDAIINIIDKDYNVFQLKISVKAEDINPTEYILGDVNNDGHINAVDASTVLTYYALISTNKDGGFSSAQKISADVNNDGLINAVDASCILSYYAYVSTTKENIMSLEEFLKK